MPQPIRILVVEDEAVIRLDLQDRLEGLGHDVVGMTDTAADGIRLAKNLKPDLVFMDIRLKGKMDGISAAEQIREQTRIPVIFLTAFADDDTLLRAKMTEPFGYLHKPCQDRDLKTAIEIGLHKNEIERKLRDSEQRYKTTVNNINEGIIAVDSQGSVTMLNPAAELLTGWREDEAKGQPFRKIFAIQPDDGRAASADPVRDVLRDGRTIQSPVASVLLGKGGRETLIDDSVIPVFEEGQHRPSGAVVSFRDVGERLRSEHRIRQLQKLESLGTMASGIAHDFNNLLTPVSGFAALLRTEIGNNSRAVQMLEQIENSARRAAELTKQLLSYSGRSTLTVKPINLSKLVSDMMILLNISISRKAEIKLDLHDSLPPTDGDESQIQQVVMNLLTNASESLPMGAGAIRVSTGVKQMTAEDFVGSAGDPGAAPGEYVYLEVADEGVGMNGETISKIFDPFFTTKFTGRGLGLSAVLGIVRGHHGVLFAKSELGKGSTFRVYLPKSHRRQESSGSVHITPQPTVPVQGRILIVEDEKPIRLLLKTLFERAGHQTLLAEDGRQAVDWHGDKLASVDVAMIDLLMPRMDGLETARELRNRRSDLKIVLMSGFAPEELSSKLGELIVSAILQKPFKTENVLSIIGTLLRR